MDRRLLVGALLGGVTVLAATGVVIVIADSRDPVFIAGDQPVTAQQVHTKLQADGYSDIRIVREGRYFEANGAAGRFADRPSRQRR